MPRGCCLIVLLAVYCLFGTVYSEGHHCLFDLSVDLSLIVLICLVGSSEWGRYVFFFVVCLLF